MSLERKKKFKICLIIIYSGKNLLNVLIFPLYKVKWRTRVSSKIKIAYLRISIIPYTYSSTKILYFINILSFEIVTPSQTLPFLCLFICNEKLTEKVIYITMSPLKKKIFLLQPLLSGFCLHIITAMPKHCQIQENVSVLFIPDSPMSQPYFSCDFGYSILSAPFLRSLFFCLSQALFSACSL